MNTFMEQILDMFDDCDTFSLTSTLKIETIPKADKQNLFDGELERIKTWMKPYHEKSIEKGVKLPPYDDFFAEVLNEVSAFCKNLENENTKPAGSPFICDHVGKDTKYFEPMEYVWHFYHNLQHHLMSMEELKKLPETENFETLQFENPFNANLKPHLLNHEYTFETHCTGGPLQLVFYFNLNNETKAWLNQFKDDYAFFDKNMPDCNFEDLAIYKNGKLMFSSCTHEQFNSLDSAYNI